MAPSDFWLFAALKKPLKGIHVTCDEEVQVVTGKLFLGQPQEFYTDGFEKLVQRWRLCIEREGHFVEKCGIDGKVHILGYILCFVSFRYLAWIKKELRLSHCVGNHLKV